MKKQIAFRLDVLFYLFASLFFAGSLLHLSFMTSSMRTIFVAIGAILLSLGSIQTNRLNQNLQTKE